MPEVTVKYKNKKTLEALKDLAKYFDYVISSIESNRKKSKQININGVTIISADSSVDTSNMNELLTGKNISADQLRIDAWQRKK